MRTTLAAMILSVLFTDAFTQKKLTAEIDRLITRPESEAHLTFLASDEMRGRNTGSPELQIAANYIRTQFRIAGVAPAPGTDDYFQRVDLVKSSPPSGAEASLAGETFVLKESLVVLGGESVQWAGDLLYAGYASQEDLEKLDVQGKVILALAGSKDTESINRAYSASREKYDLVKKLGAAGLIEIVALPQVPWPAFAGSFNQPVWTISQPQPSIPWAWVKPRDLKSFSLKAGQTVPGKISIEKPKSEMVKGKNVAALIPGTDSRLKEEYVIITAHYDHIGVQKTATTADSIFNGARDNATGTVALIQTAKFLTKYPPKRSVLLVAVTSEEKGLLGSKWYAENPLVPLSKHVLNINCDGVGYNDKTRVTSISLGRTNRDRLLEQAAKTYGFSLGGDPDPKENFFERSDQVSFARKGIPAVKLQPGLAQMDDEIRKYYHRQADEVSSMDLDYITKFYRTFVYAVHLLVNDPERPAWKPGDKFEEVSKKLYGTN